MSRRIKVEVGSGNIFADLKRPDAETHFLKAQIVSKCAARTQSEQFNLVGTDSINVLKMAINEAFEFCLTTAFG